MVGETVVVEYKVQTGTDGLNAPVFSYTEQDVSDVLISPGSLSDITDSNRPDGHLVRWTLHFPKTFTGDLEGCRVKVYGAWYRVVGAPGRYQSDNTPTRWDMPVEVEAVDG
ncbi:MAG: hypothetical protein LBQ21_07470 [Clostridiales Family XIII bacterium]|nr:hypothetical protein [Clostridiales Family XIII bacterium]